MGGTVGVISGDFARYSDFCQALTILGKPEGTKLIWTRGHDVAGNRNTVCRNFQGNWVWFIDDDHVFNPDLLLRLVSHNVDVVVPMVLNRMPPYDPVAYTGENENGEHTGGIDELPEHGLAELYAAGTAGMLIRRHVLEEIGDPWFEERGGPNEDLTFCAKVREAGFRIWVDTDCLMGHMSPHTVWPAYREGGWHADIELSHRLTLPLRRELKVPA